MYMTPARLALFSYLLSGLIREVWGWLNVRVCLRGSQESRNHLQNVRIALRSVIESRGIDENDPSPVESKQIRTLDLGRT